MSTITLILHAGNMGDVTEADYDAWAAYVAARIDDATGLDIDVEQERFGVSLERDRVSGAEGDEMRVRDALAALWEDFCGDDSAWPGGQERAVDA